MTSKTETHLSIVIPVLDEEKNIPELYGKIVNALHGLGESSYEIIFIDDGSTDDTLGMLERLHTEDSSVKIVKFRTNLGKAAAYSVGFMKAQGDIVITMDGDLQDDPTEIGKFLDKIEEGYDVVTGWKHRGKGPMAKKLPSKFFNRVVSIVTGLKLHDFNCPFKAYRHHVLKNLRIYGELYRFIPVLLYTKGYRIAEIKVENHPRKYGRSKYGCGRFMRGFLDLITVVFITQYDQSPLYLFGYAGTLLFAVGFLIDAILTFQGLFITGRVGHTALLLLGILLMILGVQLFATGLLGDLVISRQRQDLDSYAIEKTVE